MCNYEFLCGSCGGELISKKTASKFVVYVSENDNKETVVYVFEHVF